MTSDSNSSHRPIIRRFTFLGTGTSQGVPVIGCICNVCTSDDPRDKRLRCSALLTIENEGITTNIVIDTGPDFRQQMLREKINDLTAVLYTHEHSDHTAGLDDIRPFNFRQKRSMPLYADPSVQKALKARFDYAFSENPYPGVPQLDLITINKNDLITINNVAIQPIEVMHGNLPILGFRCGDLTYITDCKSIEPAEMEKIRGTKILILDALHHQEHHAHLNLNQALDIVTELQPEQAYFIHCSHHIGRIADINEALPTGVALAYDGLSFVF
ncbi:MAG: MBL fold metallo-hydrolase [Saprospiraceae bacterium]|nr:MBL fold metallo-hydrolase [Saprospiraceae bacterium]